MIEHIKVDTHGQQLIEVTALVESKLNKAQSTQGLLTVFIRHTSASLLIQENADSSVQDDLIAWMNKVVPESDSFYTHTTEGPDDMPAHIKCMLTQTSIGIPYADKQLLLGTWQGLYLFEHRSHRQRRELILHY